MGVRRKPSLTPLNSPNPQKGESGRLSLFPESQVSQEFSLSNSSLSPLSVSSSSIANQSFCNTPSVLSCEGSVQSSSIDLIQGTFCARNEGCEDSTGEREELREFFRDLKYYVEQAGYLFSREEKRFLWSFALRHYRKFKSAYKLVRAYLRLIKHERGWCGLTGHLLLEKRGDEISGVSRVPHSCGSVVCEYCNVRQSRKRLAKVLPFLRSVIESGRELSFITLTVPNSFDIFENVSALSKGFRKLYLMKFGERAWKEIKKEFYKECREYYRNLRKKGIDRAEAKKKVRFQIRLFEDFERRKRELESKRGGKSIRFKDMFGFAVWKYELTYSQDSGFHSHFHGITDLFIPKLLLTVLSRRASLGGICDVRAVRGSEAVVELMKYETKAFELAGLDFEGKLLVELALMSFKRFRVWGEVERKRSEDVEFLGLPNVLVSLRGVHDYLTLFNEVRETKKPIRVSVSITNNTFVLRRLQSFEVPTREWSLDVEAEIRADGEMYLDCLLEDEDMRDLLRRAVNDFGEFCWLNSSDFRKGLKAQERFIRFAKALSVPARRSAPA